MADMDMVRIRKILLLKNEKGQSTVEYILLFAVIASLASFVFKSSVFLDLFGDNGTFGNVYKRKVEYSYRHGLDGSTPFTAPNYSGGDHDTYKGRFFGPVEAYP